MGGLRRVRLRSRDDEGSCWVVVCWWKDGMIECIVTYSQTLCRNLLFSKSLRKIGQT